MAIEALKCKECGTTYALEARFVCDDCFGPLEVAYDFSGLDAETTRRRIQAGFKLKPINMLLISGFIIVAQAIL